MLDKSLFASDEVIKKSVALPDGKTHTLYFKEPSAKSFRKFSLLEHSDDEDEKAGSLAYLIAECLCEPDGSPAITVEEAMRLKPMVMVAIFNAVQEISGVASGND